MRAINWLPSLLLMNSTLHFSDNARGMPEPRPRYGIVLAQNFTIWGFLGNELPSMTCSTVWPPGRQPALTISTRSSNTNKRIEAGFSKSRWIRAFCNNSSNTGSGISSSPTELKDCPFWGRFKQDFSHIIPCSYISGTVPSKSRLSLYLVPPILLP